MTRAWIRRILALCSAATKARAFALMLLRVCSRLLVVVTAVVVATGNAVNATAIGVFTAATMLVQRALHTSTRVSVERDMYRATAESFLASDVLDVDEANPEREFLSGIHDAARLVYETGPAILADAIALVIVLPYIVVVSPPRFVALVALAGVALALGSFAVRGRTRRIEEEINAAFRALVEQLFAAVDGRVEIVASGRDRAFVSRFEAVLERYHREGRRLSIISATLGRTPLAGAVVLVLGVALLDGQSRDVLTRTVLSQALVLAACLPPVFGVVIGGYGLIRVSSHLEPFLDLFARPRRVETGSEKVELPAPFVAEGISFSYGADRTLVFEGVRLHWDSGILATTGANGSGKSTLLRLLMGLRSPSAGTLTNGGVSLQDIALSSWRAGIAYLPQRPYLGEPHVTLRGALRLACPDASDARMVAELKAVGLYAMLHARPEVLGVRVGELSAGQRQRLAIARVLLQDAKLLVLDEPDANLDARGIELVASLIARMKEEGKMIAVAAHTKELVAIADVVVDLETR